MQNLSSRIGPYSTRAKLHQWINDGHGVTAVTLYFVHRLTGILIDIRDTNAIIRVYLYHRRNFNLVIVRSRPHNIQIFDHLPIKLIFLVLRNLDIRSFFYFLSKYSLEGLQGLLRAGLTHYFTIVNLYRPLVTDKCLTYSGFKGFLFLFTAKRYCFDYLQSSAHYRVLPPSTFAKLTHISPSRLLHLSGPTLQTVPGTYNMMDTPARRPNLENAKLERGVSCKGCQVRLELLRGNSHRLARDRTFSTQGFLSHFTAYVEAQYIWAESEDGTRPVNEPKLTRRCGYFTRLGSDGLPR
ncbi:hypothetical protein QBC40DRAFT_306036 [Triangularia verruculosa]|uniref:Uncharacterized protein n=1 Tax=Triangularia verruculosa TaxID=2587418 RepID=A0AAN6XIG4_9PEZI|nr:hypothetical protein QBC40DRAFT_306036 [Triangularia verruculosa]